MKCLHCGGEMVKSVAPFTASRHGYTISWQAIPASVCKRCGEPYFDELEVSHIQSTLRELDKKTQELQAKTA